MKGLKKTKEKHSELFLDGARRAEEMKKSAEHVQSSILQLSFDRPKKIQAFFFSFFKPFNLHVKGLSTSRTQNSLTVTIVPASTTSVCAGISMYPSAFAMLVMSPDALNAGSARPSTSFTV